MGCRCGLLRRGLLGAKNAGRDASDRLDPPNISALGGFKTENGSWGVGAGLFRTWDGDRWRYLGDSAKVDPISIYGPLGRPNSYSLRGLWPVQQLSMRLADSDWMVGDVAYTCPPRPIFCRGCLHRCGHPSWHSISESWACWSTTTAVTTSSHRPGDLLRTRAGGRAQLAWVQREDFEGIAARAFNYTPLGRQRRARSARI